jgi:magnesium transporter
MEPDDRAAVEEALGYPEESAGRLMQRDLCAVPEHWKVGQVIDYLRSTDDLPTDFWEVFVVSTDHHPVGTCKLSTILRTPRATQVSEIMSRNVVTVPTSAPIGDVAKILSEKRITGLPVVDDDGNVVGVLSEYDIISRQGTTPPHPARR